MNPSSVLPAKSRHCAGQCSDTEFTGGGRRRGHEFFPRPRFRSNLLFIAAAILIAPGLRAQVKVATTPVGFTTVTIPAGEVRALSLPLNSFPVFSGVVSALSGNTIQTFNANWSNSFGPFASNPHVVRFLSGANKGGQFSVLSNTQDTLALSASHNQIRALLSVGDRYDILPVATLESLFGSDAPGLVRNVDSNLADNVVLYGASGWLTYYNNGMQWLRKGAGYISQNTVALLPEKGFLLVHHGPTPVAFSFAGVVPVTNLRTPLPAGHVTALGNRFPMTLRLSDLKLNRLPGWVANSAAGAADSILIYENSAWRAYYHDGADWLSELTGSTPQDPIIALGTSVLVVRLPGTDAILDQAPPY